MARAIQLMTHATQERKPFFIYLPLTSMHSPLQWPARFNEVQADGRRGR